MAQNCKINGIVCDSKTHLPIEYASISVHLLSDSSFKGGTISDIKGFFEMKNLKPASYFIDVDFIGFRKKRIKGINFDVNYETRNLDTIYLEIGEMELDAVEIEAKKQRIEYQIDKKVVNVAGDLKIAGGTAVNALENVPSVEVNYEGNVKVRGSSSFTVLVDGMPSPYKGTEALKQIPAATIDKIEIITNPSAKYDPDGSSGIINVILKKK